MQSIVGQRFEIERAAAKGGMGTVYRARDVLTGKIVALKLLHKAGAPADMQRFAREARVLAELSHPGIVRYIAHGVTPEGEPYLAMEWLDGETLASRLARGALSIEASVALAMRVAEALGVAHARGIVHRDIKPPNLFLLGGDVLSIKLVDFGIVRRAVESRALTRTDMFVGTPAYAAPEQARGAKELDVRADVFSLGCVLFECLAGRPPFMGDTIMAILAKILFDDPPFLRDLNGAIPQVLSDLVARMLCKDPAGRPANGAEVMAELSAVGDPTIVPTDAVVLPTLTTAEQRVISVILAGAGGDVAGAAAPTLTPDEVMEPFQRLHALLAPLAPRIECLPNGTAIAALSGKGSATDQAVQAARCVLAMRAMLPDVPMVLTTGRSQLAGRVFVGEAIDRAVELLSAQAHTWTSAATPRPVWIDDVTAALLELRFDIGGTPEARELLGERDADEGARTLLGKPTSCVGRDRELDVLDGYWDECVTDSEAQMVIVTGEAGMGKSRLRFEFVRRVRQKAHTAGGTLPQIWIAQGDPIHEGSSFGMAAQLLRCATGVLAGEPLDIRQQKVRSRVAASVRQPDADRVAGFLGELVGTPFPDEGNVPLRAARRDPMLMGVHTRQAWVDFMAAECAVNPVLIVLEDLHWGDLPSVQLVQAMCQSLSDSPVLVLALARPSLYDRFPKLQTDNEVQEIRLGKLSRKASERLAREVLGESVPEEHIARVVGQSAGNALHLEELIRAFAEGKAGLLPMTVLAILQARLEGLEPPARQIVRAASVFGEVFWAAAVAFLLGSSTDMHQTNEWLDELCGREIVVQRAHSRFSDERELAFRHEFGCAAAYGMLTEDDRVLGHRLAGAWLERMGEQDAMVLAEHLERGGEKSRAAVFFQRAAEQALEANDLSGVIARSERAIACGAEGELLGTVRQIETEARMWRNDIASSEASGLEAIALLPAGSPRWLKATTIVAIVVFQLGNAERLSWIAEQLLDRVVEPSSVGLHIIAMAQVGRYLLRSGMLDLVERIFERLATARDDMAHDPAVLGYVHAAFASRSLFEGNPAAAHASFEASYRSFDLAGDSRQATVRRMSAALTLMDLGVHERAEAALNEVFAESNRFEMRAVSAVVKCRLALVLAFRGMLDEARAAAEDARAVLLAGGARWYGSIAHRNLALIFQEMGRFEQAEIEAEQAVNRCDIPSDRCPALAVLGQVRLRRGRAAEALEAAAEAMRLLDMMGGLEEGEALVRVVFAEALYASGKQDEARRAITSAKARLLARAASIDDDVLRRGFLERVPEHARTIELATQWQAL